MLDLRSLSADRASTTEQVGHALSEILVELTERGVRLTLLNVIAYATDHGASEELGTELAALLMQRTSPGGGEVLGGARGDALKGVDPTWRTSRPDG